MKSPVQFLCRALISILALGAPGARAAASADMLAGAHRVLFLGDSITYSGQFVEIVDAYFSTRFPGRAIEFLNLGLPSETVSGLSEEGHANGAFPRPDLHERLERVLAKAKPDVVIAGYGMNDGIYLPFDAERFSKFTNGLVWLRERVQAAGARIIHLTPPVFDEVRGGHPGYGDALDQYSDWMLTQRAAAGWEVIDVHGPMKKYLLDRRRNEPGFFLAGDGVHPNETGHWIIARQILLHLGAADLGNAGAATELFNNETRGSEIYKLVQQRQRLLKDAWLTDTGHLRPGMKKGMAIAQAQIKSAEIAAQISGGSAGTGSLPVPWRHQDVGAAEVPGSAAVAGGVFTLKGTQDTWGTNDGFHFVWQPFRGNGEVVARILSVENTMNHAKAGVMFRESLAADSSHAEVCVTPVDGTQFLARTESGGKTTSAHTGKDKGKLPYWVKLVRLGNVFTGYESADGKDWNLIGSTNISMKVDIVAGLVTSSHQKSILCTSTIDQVAVTFSP